MGISKPPRRVAPMAPPVITGADVAENFTEIDAMGNPVTGPQTADENVLPYGYAGGGQVLNPLEYLLSMQSQGYAAGGRLLHGDGDGLSDDIQASIDGSQPAALADGEYVISADVVSALGGGSTDAGAKLLDEMMARIRNSAHGSSKQINHVNPKRVLPA